MTLSTPTSPRSRPASPSSTPRRPPAPSHERWDTRRFEAKLVNPANRRKHTVIVVGTGLAGGSAGATLAEQGYHVVQFCYQDSPRRAHSIAAQGGINAAKNYRNDGDSVHRLFYDTVKGGDFRARESNVHRLAQISVEIIDQCVAQGVPFAREYGGLLDTRSFGGVQVSRTFYARGQTGQQLLLGAYQALSRQIAAGNVEMHARTEMLDLIVVDGRARGIVARDLVTGKIASHFADAVVLATGGYGNVFYLSTNAMNSNATAVWRAHRRGAYFANPCFTQIHPTCIPRTGDHQSKLTLMSESLRNDGRIWVPKAKGDERPAERDPRGRARLLPGAHLPVLRQPGAPRHRLPRRQERLRRGPGRRPRRTGRLPRLRRRHRADGPRRRSRRSTATSSTCTSGSPPRTRTRSRCGSTPPCTTRWAASGSTTTSRPPSPACSRSARPTSPTTAPTGSAPPR